MFVGSAYFGVCGGGELYPIEGLGQRLCFVCAWKPHLITIHLVN